MRFCEQEEWRAVVGFEGLYEISSFGRVRSLRWKQPKMLRPGIASSGYPTVTLGRHNTRTLHSLVADAFLGPRPKGQEVRHKDGCRTNPRADNLEFGTRTDNIYDAVRHGTWNHGAAMHVKSWTTRRQRYGVKGVR